jgi:hypothetical protein
VPRLTPPDRSRRAFLAIAAVFLLLTLDTGLRGMAALGQTGFDSPEVRAASDVVLPALLRGPRCQLGPTVRTFAFMNQYLVASDYGAFTATSDARVRRLVREIAAIAELQKIHQSDAFAKATVEAGKGVVQGAPHLIQDPVATIAAVPEAVFSVFGRGYRRLRNEAPEANTRTERRRTCSPYPASSANMHKSLTSMSIPATKFCKRSSTASPGPLLPAI